MAELPIEVGALKRRVAKPFPGVALTIVGAPGAPEIAIVVVYPYSYG